MSTQLRLHAFPYIGSRPLGSFQPSHIREWTSALEKALPVSSYRRVIFSSVSAVFSAAVDDKHLPANPCRARSVRAPKSNPPRVQPWTASRVFAVRAALPEQYRAMVDLGGGCGLRQGEIFGLAVDAVNHETGWLHVGCQVKVANGHLVFGLPKRSKERDVPLSQHVAQVLKEHSEKFPPVDVTLPWLLPNGPKVTKRLFFARLDGHGAVRRTDFNTRAWKPALAEAGVIAPAKKGKRYVASREDGMHALRHFYASVLRASGENVKALSHYLGHDDPGFTLRVYTHLMPSSDGRARRAVDGMYAAQKAARRAAARAPDGPQTAQGA